MDERMVADVWERQAFDRSALAGLGLTVLFRGLPSDAGGPDYQEAVLARDGRSIINGDIEFHVTASDWYAHGHHRDPHYDSVVLHVVWEGGPETITSSGRCVPTLVLRGSATIVTPLQLGLPPLEHPCVAAYAGLSPNMLQANVRAAGTARFHDRASRFAADLTTCEADQVIYTAILEALGYASNRSVFRALADAAPYSWIMSLPPHRRRDALLHAAGFERARDVVPPVRLQPDAWRLSRLRPANHPVLRLTGMAVLLERFGPSMCASLDRHLLEDAPMPRAAVDLMTVRAGATHPIGSGRATEILASAVLPFLAAFRPDDLRAEELFAVLPAPPSNRWTRAMLALLAEADRTIRVRSAPEHQGLHWLYHNHCRYERRATCPICGAHRTGATGGTAGSAG
jgi:hypothetical protein